MVLYTKGVRKIQLPEKVRRFLVPGVLLLVVFFIAGGFYFRRRSLGLVPQLTVPEEGGEVSGLQTNLPENFPEDVPLFEPSEILSGLESKERIQVTFQTDASAERVSQFYQQGMSDRGWKLAGRGVSEDSGVLTFSKDSRYTQLTITPSPEGPTLVILSTTP